MSPKALLLKFTLQHSVHRDTPGTYLDHAAIALGHTSERVCLLAPAPALAPALFFALGAHVFQYVVTWI